MRVDYRFLLLSITALSITACGGSSGDNTPLSTEKLVASYPFSGNTQDVSGSKAHAISRGAALTTDRNGKANSAFQFDGVNDFIEVTSKNATALNVSKQITFEAWINISGYFNSRLFPIVAKGRLAPRYSFMAANDGNFYVLLENQVTALRDDNVMKLNKWYHIAVTWDGSTIKYYKDGVLVSTSAARVAQLTLAKNESLLIGNDPNDFEEFAKGKIDDVKIWDIVRTAQQIKNGM
ncbi:MAG: LamG domain-containing protein [Cocleimonas sp.]|nr:LamG domain-containing protein [Cocleimonas sp.]